MKSRAARGARICRWGCALGCGTTATSRRATMTTPRSTAPACRAARTGPPGCWWLPECLLWRRSARRSTSAGWVAALRRPLRREWLLAHTSPSSSSPASRPCRSGIAMAEQSPPSAGHPQRCMCSLAEPSCDIELRGAVCGHICLHSTGCNVLSQSLNDVHHLTSDTLWHRRSSWWARWRRARCSRCCSCPQRQVRCGCPRWRAPGRCSSPSRCCCRCGLWNSKFGPAGFYKTTRLVSAK